MLKKEELIQAFGEGYTVLKDFTDGLSEEAMDYKPGPEAWSCREIIMHLLDSEINAYVRIRKLISENGSIIMPYDQDAWCSELRYKDMDWKAALELFGWIRKANVAIVENTPENYWTTHAVVHYEKGCMDLEDMIEIYTEHVHRHISQMKKNVSIMEKAGKSVA